MWDECARLIFNNESVASSLAVRPMLVGSIPTHDEQMLFVLCLGVQVSTEWFNISTPRLHFKTFSSE